MRFSDTGELDNGRLLTNHFRILTGNVTQIHEYSISIQAVRKKKDAAPSEPPRIIKRRLMYLLIKELNANLDNRGPPASHINIATDYNNSLFTVTRLPDDMINKIDTLELFEEVHDGSEQRPQEFQYVINPAIDLPLQDLCQHLDKPGSVPEPDVADRDAILRALNAILGSRPSKHTFTDLLSNPTQAQTIFSVGKNKFFEQTQTAWHVGTSQPPWNLMNGLYAHVGISMSAKVPSVGIPGQLLLNLNTATSAFYRPGPLNDLISQYGTGNLGRLQTFLKGLRVATTYRHGLRQPEMVQSIAGLPRVDRLPTAGNETTNANGFAQSISSYFQCKSSSIALFND